MMPGLSDAERTLYTLRLTKAEESYDLIATGKSVKRFVDQNGETIEYTAASLSALARYIADLRALLNPCLAAYNRPRPIGFLF